MTRVPESAPPPPATPGSIKRRPVRRLNSRELLAGEQEIIILHAGREYRLRVTSNDKLILTA